MGTSPIPCLVGTTGCGKTEVGIELARHTAGEVICCDAYTVYRHMPILTAAPTPPADVPHHLLGIVDSDGSYNAVRFLHDCDRAVAKITAANHQPLIVGGTALYLRCWLKGLGPKAPRDEAFRETLQACVAEEGPQALHGELLKLDPNRAAELHPNDVRRVVRALEIIRFTGRPASDQRLEWSGPDRVSAVVVGLRRDFEDLDRRIEARTAAMFEAGLLDEARALIERSLSPEAEKVLGLAELRLLFAGTIDESEARTRIIQRTKRFARKQMTFFRSFNPITWVDVQAGNEPVAVAERVLEALDQASREASSNNG